MTVTNTPDNLKLCLECGEPLGAGRSDRKFCNDICRTAYNNRRRSDSSVAPAIPNQPDPEQGGHDRDMAAIHSVYLILLDNRVKLYNMYGFSERFLSIEDFNRYGVNLNYFTSLYKDDYYEKVFKMCFDYGYHIDGERVYLVYYANEIYLK